VSRSRAFAEPNLLGFSSGVFADAPGNPGFCFDPTHETLDRLGVSLAAELTDISADGVDFGIGRGFLKCSTQVFRVQCTDLEHPCEELGDGIGFGIGRGFSYRLQSRRARGLSPGFGCQPKAGYQSCKPKQRQHIGILEKS
jgi:hypothetical protein